ncbi:mitochondrial ribosomal death-associated protein 3-domain-containing protein [Mycena pura]|uniref:Small ribosomal subunit protein mS29 n=1 Tax=Mycena pura TaxID=153505 RepID=A0AAD6YV97_9AGAR|nr:mitochondrial ribosomal death-associated protein 3-domain-containing protein [Mycena pura]
MLAPGVVTRFHDSDPTSPLRVFGVPKHMLLEFRVLGAPCSVTTATTLSLIRALEEAKAHPARLVLNGRPGCGKSFLLLQAAQYASSSREWIVLYIPRARRLVDASTPYAYSLATRTYVQPRAARETLARLGRANAHLLAHLRTTVSVTLDGKTAAVPVRAGAPLLALVDAGTADEAAAPAALDALLRELGVQTRFPVLLAIDDFQALAGGSMYRDPHFRMIRPHHLGLPRLLLEYASGRRTLARGLVLGALTRSDPQFPVSDQLAASLRIPEEFEPTPRSAAPKTVRALRAIRVPDALSVREAAALFELWLDAGVLRTGAKEAGADELFLAKYAESSGNARVFVWGGLLATLQTLG